MNTINTNLAYRDEYLYENVIENEGVQEIATTTDLARIDKENKVVKILKNGVIRIIDIIGSIIGIILLIPITILIIIMKLVHKDRGPIIYTQNRVGKGGKLFKLYKFRTMVVGADEILDKYLQENETARMEYEINKKLKNDPRVTKIGKILRKTSLDEFPQFINVLKGEMSLVGPRPYLPKEVEDMGNVYYTIVQCKPGITGLWQVSGRSDVSFDERMELDIIYNKKHSILQDIIIILKTIGKIIKREGAI